jgi:hypothetical protein
MKEEKEGTIDLLHNIAIIPQVIGEEASKGTIMNWYCEQQGVSHEEYQAKKKKEYDDWYNSEEQVEKRKRQAEKERLYIIEQQELSKKYYEQNPSDQHPDGWGYNNFYIEYNTGRIMGEYLDMGN